MRDIFAAMEAGEVIVGHWVASGSPTIVELIGASGTDVVAIDCEHGPLSPYGAELDGCLRAAYAADVTPVVRVSGHDPLQVARAADLGARGVLVPHVNSAAQLRELIAHVKLPPVGNRGCHPTVRAAAHGWRPWAEFVADTNASVEVIPMLEEPAAFDVLDEILDVDGLRAVALGPLDLASRLGGAGAGDPAAQARVDELLAVLVQGAGRRGISVLGAAYDLESFSQRVRAGCRGVLYSGDTFLLVAALREQLAGVRAFLAVVS